MHSNMRKERSRTCVQLTAALLLLAAKVALAQGTPEYDVHGTSCNAAAEMLPDGLLTPVTAERASQSRNAWGQARNDSYAWLQDKIRSNPEVLAYLEQENDYTERVLGGQLADELEAEMAARVAKTDEGVPQRVGQLWTYWYRLKGQQHRVHARRMITEEFAMPTEDDVMDRSVPEEVVLDENVLAEGHVGFSLEGFEVSADQKRVAYALDLTGEEQYEVYSKDIASGLVTQLTRKSDSSGSIAWAMDNITLFYVTLTEETERPYRVWRVRVNDSKAAPEMVYEEPDEAFSLSLSKTHNRQHILLYGESASTKYASALPAAAPTGDWAVKGPKVHGRKCLKLEEWNGTWVALVSDAQLDTLNAELLVLHDSTEAGFAAEGLHEIATVVVPHSHDVGLEDFEVFESHLALMKRINGLSTISTYRLSPSGLLGIGGQEPLLLEFEEDSYALQFGEQGPFSSSVLRVTYSSLITPDSTFDVNMATGKRVLKKEQAVLGGYKKEHHRAFRIWADSLHGTQVPISVVHRKGAVALDGTDALVLYVYGAYGVPADADFDATRLSLLDRGFVFAIAHVRGGGDLGQYWYLDGRLDNKPNTFKDTVAAATHLIKEGYTSPGRLCLWGASAGGLTVAAAINMRPELFQAAVLGVPFVDVISTMSDSALPATVTEYEEWGNPMVNRSTYDLMLSYSPIDNVKQQPYPNMLAIGGLYDSRVSFWEPAKWVAKTRRLTTGRPVILLLTQMEAGHAGLSGVYAQLRETALQQAFLLRATCMATQRSGEDAGEEAQMCIPCLVFFVVIIAGFAGLVVGSLYYGGATLQSVWAVGKQRGMGVREVALQGFERTATAEKDAEHDAETGADERLTDQETLRLIAHEREP